MDETQQALFKAGFDLAKEYCESAAAIAINAAKEQMGKIAVELNFGFTHYLTAHIERFSKIKTLVNRHVPADFLSIYVDSYVGVKNRLYSETQFIKLLFEKRLIVLTGLAGSGKSMLIRRLFLRLLEKNQGYIPLFVALRELNNGNTSKTLEDALFNELHKPIGKLTLSQFDYGLKEGKFLLLLDGLDEVPPDARLEVSKQIIELSQQYPKLIMLCTSRPNEAFIAWNEFIVGEVEPLNSAQVIELIRNSPYDDDEAKAKFLSQVENLPEEHAFSSKSSGQAGALSEQHRAFLSNPLLCLMMLLTYDEHKEIPGKMHIFYSLAYDVLYGTHDKSKGHGFKRQFYTRLEPDQFRSAFCTFCTLLYVAKKITVTLDEARIFARKALSWHSIQVDANKFLDDLIESVSIVVKDGLYISFIHRSFQEYFVAVYAVERYAENIYAIVDFAMRRGDEVIPLFFQINRDAYERKYLKKKLEIVINEIESIGIDERPTAVFKLFFLGIHVQEYRDLSPGQKRFEMGLVVGSVEEQAKLSNFLDSISNLYEKTRQLWPLGEFAWEKWAKKHRASSEGGNGSVFEAEISDVLLRETPIVDFLHRILNCLKALQLEIETRELAQENIFLDVSSKDSLI